jgi:carbon-monoxide dehydrogenase large subunit
MPSFQVSTIEVPCKNNPMGVKGCGEAGSVASPAAVINALIDALADLACAPSTCPRPRSGSGS